jgi:hypothetical protein
MHIDEKREKQQKQPERTHHRHTKTSSSTGNTHPNDIDRKKIRQIYEEKLEVHDDFNAMTVCYSRPKI